MRLKKLTGALSLLTISGLASLCIGGCAENRTTLFIHHIFHFEPGECEISANLNDLPQATGIWNPALGKAYFAGLIIANGLQRLGDTDTLRAETSRIQLEGVEVSISDASGAAARAAFTVPFSATIDPEASEDPGLTAAYPVALIPADAGLDDGLYTLNLRVFGTTLSGKSVESEDFLFPVTADRTSGLYCGSVDDVPEEKIHPCGLPQDGYLGVFCGPGACGCPP